MKTTPPHRRGSLLASKRKVHGKANGTVNGGESYGLNKLPTIYRMHVFKFSPELIKITEKRYPNINNISEDKHYANCIGYLLNDEGPRYVVNSGDYFYTNITNYATGVKKTDTNNTFRVRIEDGKYVLKSLRPGEEPKRLHNMQILLKGHAKEEGMEEKNYTFKMLGVYEDKLYKYILDQKPTEEPDKYDKLLRDTIINVHTKNTTSIIEKQSKQKQAKQNEAQFEQNQNEMNKAKSKQQETDKNKQKQNKDFYEKMGKQAAEKKAKEANEKKAKEANEKKAAENKAVEKKTAEKKAAEKKTVEKKANKEKNDLIDHILSSNDTAAAILNVNTDAEIEKGRRKVLFKLHPDKFSETDKNDTNMIDNAKLARTKMEDAIARRMKGGYLSRTQRKEKKSEKERKEKKSEKERKEKERKKKDRIKKK